MANYKKASVVVLANATGTQTLTNAGSGVRLQWTETSDLTNYAQAATHLTNHKFTAPYTGFYQVSVSLYFGSSVTLTAGFITVVLNNSLAGGIILSNGAVAAGQVQNASRVFRLNKGDTVDIYATQTSGSDRTPDAVNSVLSIVRLGNAS
jgi:hypothetical protein